MKKEKPALVVHERCKIYSAAEAAAVLGFSLNFVRKQYLYGNLKCCRIGRRVLITQEQLDDFLKRQVAS